MNKPVLSDKAIRFRRNISPVRQIMSFAEPGYLKEIGVDPANLISFAGGWVNHHAPETYRTAYKEIIDDRERFHNSGNYSPTLGSNETKKAVIRFEEYLYGIQNLTYENIVIGQSSTQLAMDLFQVLLNPGEKILLLDPSYCNFPTQVFSGIYNVEILRFPVLDPQTWHYHPDEKISELQDFVIKNKPKVFLLIIPDNPTSSILSNEFFSKALEVMTEIGGFLVVDYAYKELVFDLPDPGYFSMPVCANYISIYSNSKWCRGLGRRMGWLLADPEIIMAMESIANSSILCPDMLHQLAFIDYVNKAVEDNSLNKYLDETRNLYKKAAQCTTEAIRRFVGMPFLEPGGGLYTCMKIGENSAAFVEELLKATGVLLVPGWGFGRTVNEAVRISYGPLVNNHEKIIEGMERLGKYMQNRHIVKK